MSPSLAGLTFRIAVVLALVLWDHSAIELGHPIHSLLWRSQAGAPGRSWKSGYLGKRSPGRWPSSRVLSRGGGRGSPLMNVGRLALPFTSEKRGREHLIDYSIPCRHFQLRGGCVWVHPCAMFCQPALSKFPSSQPS